jgi:hypothetical protein
MLALIGARLLMRRYAGTTHTHPQTIIPARSALRDTQSRVGACSDGARAGGADTQHQAAHATHSPDHPYKHHARVAGVVVPNASLPLALFCTVAAHY